jgi:hypothetical protein
VGADLGADPELFDLSAPVLLPGFLQFLFAFVAKLGKVRELANRRVVQWSDFDKVRALVLGDADRFLDRLDP